MARQTAKHASIYLGGVKVADAYGIKWDVKASFEDGSAFGDDWEVPEATGPSSWTGSADRYHTVGNVTFMSKALADPDTIYTVIFFAIEGTPSSKMWEAKCKIDGFSAEINKGTLRKEGITFLGYGDPTYAG